MASWSTVPGRAFGEKWGKRNLVKFNELNSKGKEKFDIYFSVIFDCYCKSLFPGARTGHWTRGIDCNCLGSAVLDKAFSGSELEWAKWRNPAKLEKIRKVWYLLLIDFWLLLSKFFFVEGTLGTGLCLLENFLRGI